MPERGRSASRPELPEPPPFILVEDGVFLRVGDFMHFEALLPSMTATRVAGQIVTAAKAGLDRAAERAQVWRRRTSAKSSVIWLAALVFLVLDLFAGLSTLAAVAGFTLIAAIVVSVPATGGADDSDGDAFPFESSARGGHPRDRETGEAWHTLVDAIPEPTLALDSAGYVMHHNAQVRELFPKVRSGQPLSHMSRNPDLTAAVEKAMASPETVVVQLFERIPVERRISATISRLSGGRELRGLPMLLLTFRDLTEQDKLSQMRADFVANASHELRTPLASLRGFVETLQGPARDDPDARVRFLGIMASQAARMTRLIDDLLSLSRVEMRVHLPPRGVVDLNEVASYVAQALEPLAEASKTKVSVRKLEGSARIRGDREEIVQVLQNLVHNAIKYGREGGHVEVAVSRVMDGSPPTPRVLVAIADDGPGIAAEHLPRLTERFYRANVAASREKGGTGLGLAIVKHIVIRHRGDLRISSAVGKGSTFSVLFEELNVSR
jgi:two-component system phosphate regulon sensor histidine kinase PhoR